MNHKVLGFIIMVAVFMLTSCIKDLEVKTARSGNKFLIDLPKTMVSATDIKPGAELQYKGDKKFPIHFYALTDEKNTQQTMGVNFTTEEIYYLETEEISFMGTDAKISKPKQSSIQYLTCLRGEVHLMRDGKKELFRVSVIEGGPRFYRLVVFGDEQAMHEHAKAVENIFQSFREWTEFQAQSIEG